MPENEKRHPERALDLRDPLFPRDLDLRPGPFRPWYDWDRVYEFDFLPPASPLGLMCNDVRAHFARTSAMDRRLAHMKLQKILFPTDFSHCGDEALELATALARDSGAKLLIV